MVPRPTRPRPQLSWDEAETELQRYVQNKGDAVVVNVPGGIYGGNGIIDEFLKRNALQQNGLFDALVTDFGSTCIEMFRIADRCLTDFSPVAPLPGIIAPTLSLICSWLTNRGLPLLGIDFSEAWLNDEDLETLVTLFGTGLYRAYKDSCVPERQSASCVPERIILKRNCITEDGAVEFVEVLAQLLMETPLDKAAKCILDLRFNWISDLEAFREAVARFHNPSCGLRVGVYEDENDIPMCQNDCSYAELSILAGPSWDLRSGREYMNRTTNRDKEPWDNFMAGPSSKLACVLECEWQWGRWECPLCPRSNDINEHGGQLRCPSATFGGILTRHLRGANHRKNVWEITRLEQPIEEFVNPSTGRSYFFNWISGAQGYNYVDAEDEEAERYREQLPAPPPPSCPPPGAAPPLLPP